MVLASQNSDSARLCHPPESPHQRAWLATWLELTDGGKIQETTHKDLQRLLEVYLSALSGSCTVERFIGQKPSLNPRLHALALEASLKLIVQDEFGRRREPLDASQLLVKPAAAKASGGGGTVLFPATSFLIRAQRTYANWYGERWSDARDSLPASAKDQALARARAAKPRMSVGTDPGKLSEARQLQQHTDSCRLAVARLRKDAGKEVDGVLGQKMVLEDSVGKKRLMADAAAMSWDVRKARKLKQSEPEGSRTGDDFALEIPSSSSAPAAPTGRL